MPINNWERYHGVKEQASETSLGAFTAGDLPALMGVFGLIDGITSGFHPSEDDVNTVERKLPKKAV
jgi:hypothetical protein